MATHPKDELESILRNPAARFSDPCEVICQSRLTFDEKVDVLKKWRRDLLRSQASPGKAAAEVDTAVLDKIDECLRQLYV